MFVSLLLSSYLTFVSYNCENLFDCRHDSLKRDTEYLPDGQRHWTPWRYWKKINNISQAIVSCGGAASESSGGQYVMPYGGRESCALLHADGVAGFRLPDFVALCEVENDSVMRDLTKRSLLRTARYEYLMTSSADERGIDVALMYSPLSFVPIRHYPLRVTPVADMRHTRDILYVSGRLMTGDTLHIFVVHAPSRYGGEKHSRPFRIAVARRLCSSVDSIRALSPDADIIVAGDFNDYAGDASLDTIAAHGLSDVTAAAIGRSAGSRKNKSRAGGTYRYNGRWGSLDHIFMSESLASQVFSSFVNDAPFLLEEDYKYGGFKPFRSYTGYRFSAEGTSDHLPLVVRLRLHGVADEAE